MDRVNTRFLQKALPCPRALPTPSTLSACQHLQAMVSITLQPWETQSELLPCRGDAKWDWRSMCVTLGLGHLGSRPTGSWFGIAGRSKEHPRHTDIEEAGFPMTLHQGAAVFLDTATATRQTSPAGNIYPQPEINTRIPMPKEHYICI